MAMRLAEKAKWSVEGRFNKRKLCPGVERRDPRLRYLAPRLQTITEMDENSTEEEPTTTDYQEPPVSDHLQRDNPLEQQGEELREEQGEELREEQGEQFQGLELYQEEDVFQSQASYASQVSQVSQFSQTVDPEEDTLEMRRREDDNDCTCKRLEEEIRDLRTRQEMVQKLLSRAKQVKTYISDSNDGGFKRYVEEEERSQIQTAIIYSKERDDTGYITRRISAKIDFPSNQIARVVYQEKMKNICSAVREFTHLEIYLGEDAHVMIYTPVSDDLVLPLVDYALHKDLQFKPEVSIGLMVQALELMLALWQKNCQVQSPDLPDTFVVAESPDGAFLFLFNVLTSIGSVYQTEKDQSDLSKKAAKRKERRQKLLIRKVATLFFGLIFPTKTYTEILDRLYRPTYPKSMRKLFRDMNQGRIGSLEEGILKSKCLATELLDIKTKEVMKNLNCRLEGFRARHSRHK